MITEPSMVRRYFERWSMRAMFVVLDAGECRETAQTAHRALELAMRLGELRVDRRRDSLVAIGGRSLFDIVGLTAGIFRRGLPFVQFPTTLRAQIEAGTGVNRHGVDNTLGPHRAPTNVLVDAALLATLPRQCWTNGLAEILGVATIVDAHLFELLAGNGNALCHRQLDNALSDELVARAIGVTLATREPSLAETNLEKVFPGDMPHGESVAIDIVVSAWIAHRRGLLEARDLDRIIATARGLGLLTWDCRIDPHVLVSALVDDGGGHWAVGHRTPLPVGIGKGMFVTDLTAAEVLGVCAAARAC